MIKTLFLLALKTGMRQGELIALAWGDIDLQQAVIRVRRAYSAGATTTPKNHGRRDVDLTAIWSSFSDGGGERARKDYREVIER
jgi:integrase